VLILSTKKQTTDNSWDHCSIAPLISSWLIMSHVPATVQNMLQTINVLRLLTTAVMNSLSWMWNVKKIIN